MKVKHLWLLALPFAIWLVGAAMNQTVIHINGGHMPVFLPGWDCSLISKDGPFKPDWNHVCMVHQSHLKALGDWIIGNDGVSSLGDVLMDWANELKIPVMIAFATVTLRDGLMKRQERE